MGWLRRKSGAIGIIVGVVILSAALYGYLRTNRTPLWQREIATRVLAEYISKTANPKAALIVANPYSQNRGQPAEVYAFQSTSEAGLRKGFGPDVKVKVGFPKLKPEAVRDPTSVFVDPNSTTPLSYLLAENAFDELAKEKPECEVFVSARQRGCDAILVQSWSATSRIIAARFESRGRSGDRSAGNKIRKSRCGCRGETSGRAAKFRSSRVQSRVRQTIRSRYVRERRSVAPALMALMAAGRGALDKTHAPPPYWESLPEVQAMVA